MLHAQLAKVKMDAENRERSFTRKVLTPDRPFLSSSHKDNYRDTDSPCQCPKPLPCLCPTVSALHPAQQHPVNPDTPTQPATNRKLCPLGVGNTLNFGIHPIPSNYRADIADADADCKLLTVHNRHQHRQYKPCNYLIIE